MYNRCINEKICPVCQNKAKVYLNNKTDSLYVECCACGNFEITRELIEDNFQTPKGTFDLDKLASYLFYNKNSIPLDVRLSQEFMDKQYFYITPEIVENWYPKNFSEKNDIFLLGLASRANFLGEPIIFTDEQFKSACFVRRHPEGPMRKLPDVINRQVTFFLDYLKNQQYIMTMPSQCILMPKGLERIDYLQKNNSKTTKNVFVAMSFATDMFEVREAIKSALVQCGYFPRVMDEIEHNHQIVPEMLYEIREARFVIAELTGHNNGAYFEAGYALGLGKEVIQVCQKSKFGEDGHFDVKQVNTILWDNIEDLNTRLVARIKATIT